MDNDWTLLPGHKIDDKQAQELIARFHSIYRLNTEGRPTNIPTWVTFPPGKRVEESIVSQFPITTYKALYFYFENGKEIYWASPSEIARYFAERNPWEDGWDFYVFSSSLKWAIAFTHGLAGGTATILVGNLSSEIPE